MHVSVRPERRAEALHALRDSPKAVQLWELSPSLPPAIHHAARQRRGRGILRRSLPSLRASGPGGTWGPCPKASHPFFLCTPEEM
eukprot:scaffold37274_cov34-Prasinocladus_malaysianus.AAC.1